MKLSKQSCIRCIPSKLTCRLLHAEKADSATVPGKLTRPNMTSDLQSCEASLYLHFEASCILKSDFVVLKQLTVNLIARLIFVHAFDFPIT